MYCKKHFITTKWQTVQQINMKLRCWWRHTICTNMSSIHLYDTNLHQYVLKLDNKITRPRPFKKNCHWTRSTLNPLCQALRFSKRCGHVWLGQEDKSFGTRCWSLSSQAGPLMDAAARLDALLWGICMSLAHVGSWSSVFSRAWRTRAPGNVRAATWKGLPRTQRSPRTAARTGRWRTYPLSEKHHKLLVWII